MFKKKSLKNQQGLVLLRFINTSKKTLVFLALFGQLWSAFLVQAETIENQEFIKDHSSFDNYPTTIDLDAFYVNKVDMLSENIFTLINTLGNVYDNRLYF